MFATVVSNVPKRRINFLELYLKKRISVYLVVDFTIKKHKNVFCYSIKNKF